MLVQGQSFSSKKRGELAMDASLGQIFLSERKKKKKEKRYNIQTLIIDIPSFIVLCFTALHRYCVFYKTLCQQEDYAH